MGVERCSKIVVFEKQNNNNIITSTASEPMNFASGINKFLQQLNITFRTDLTSKRPRINKINSTKDREQKQMNKYYA